MSSARVRVFSAGVLRRYVEQPEKYRVDDTVIDGSITTRDQFYLNTSESERRNEVIYLRYNKRRLVDGRQALIAWPPDFERLPRKHRLHWQSWEIKNPALVPRDKDPEFDLAVRQNLGGEFVDAPDDPIYAVAEALRAVNRVWPLFRHEENPHLILPHLDNERDYSESHNELRKLLPPDNVDEGELKKLLNALEVRDNLPDGTFQLFRNLLELLGIADTIKPFERVPRARGKLTHAIDAFVYARDDYGQLFKRDCREVADALFALAVAIERRRSEVTPHA